MGATSIRINASPESVYAHLTALTEEMEPGPLKVGDQLRVPGHGPIWTVTHVEPPTRFGFKLDGEATSNGEFKILPNGDGSLVSLELDHPPADDSMAGAWGALVNDAGELLILADLKKAIESKRRPI